MSGSTTGFDHIFKYTSGLACPVSKSNKFVNETITALLRANDG
jgi:hypothetical protein